MSGAVCELHYKRNKYKKLKCLQSVEDHRCKKQQTLSTVSVMIKPSVPLNNTAAIPKERDAVHLEEEDLTGHCSGLFANI